MDAESVLRDCIVTVCDVPADRVLSETDLDDLGIDSLTSAEIIFELEIRLGRELPNQLLRQVQQVRTVGEVAQRLATALDEPSTEAGV